jgi:hypothetical protein
MRAYLTSGATKARRDLVVTRLHGFR